MDIDLRKHDFKRGAYAHVVFTDDKTKAIKIFLKDKNKCRNHVESVFNSETKAYEFACNNKDASIIVPEFYGKININSIIDENGNDGKDKYHTDLAYVMSYEDGVSTKFPHLPKSEQTKIKNIFEPIGIKHFIDCSASLTSDKKILKVVDFATEEFELLYKGNA